MCCYADIEGVGRTSLKIHIQVWIVREAGGDRRKVTEGNFTYVALDEAGRPTPVAAG